MKSYEIKALIAEKGSTLSAVAEASGLHNSSCRQALRYPVPAANSAIAKFLGKSVHELWPEFYDEHGHKRQSVAFFRISAQSKSSQKRGRV